MKNQTIENEEVKKIVEKCIRENEMCDLRKKGINNKEIQIIMNNLKQHKTLEELHLWKNKIGNDGAKCISEFMKQSKTLKWINLDINRISDEGIKCISDGLKENNTVERLLLGWNEFNEDGLSYLLNILEKNNSTLKWLDVGLNKKIGDVGAEIISKFLLVNNTLTLLYLRNSNIGDKGASFLRDALKAKNNTLTFLFLGGNNIDKSIVDEIEGYLERNERGEKKCCC